MFRYSKKSKSDIVPETYGRYSVTKEGVVFDRLFEEKVLPYEKDGVPCVAIDLPWYGNDVPIKLLVALTYKKLWLPVAAWKSIEVLVETGIEVDLNPKNLIWRFPPDGIQVPTIPGYYFIPSFTRYAINRKGVVISLFETDIKLSSLAASGYKDIALRRDDGIYVGSNRHRLLALTFIPYDNTINEKVVNHKDGVRNNDEICNLEWVTIAENVQHGLDLKRGYAGSHRERGVMKMLVSRGLTVDHNDLDFSGVDVKDINTNEVVRFSSQLKAANALGVSTGTISLKLNDKYGYPVIKEKYIVKRPNNDWPVWDRNKDYQTPTEKETLAKNVETSEIIAFSSATEAYTKLGLSKKRVTKSLKRRDRKNIDGYIFKYARDDKPW